MVDELWDTQQVTLDVGTTDAEGKTKAVGSLDGIDLTQTSVAAGSDRDIRVYEPGGRTTGEQITLPVKTRDTAIGIRASFDYDTVAENPTPRSRWRWSTRPAIRWR